MTNDRDFAEKRLDKAGVYRSAVIYTGAVVAVAAVVFAIFVFAARGSVFAAALVPSVVFLGGVGAFVKTYLEWKADRGWAAWQGAGWFLMLLVLVTLAVPGMAMTVGAVE
ncbi:hypothetical protein [Mycobacterium sp. SMC-4]|uniref:hypothetical protein n=1 Tax=Mycobacterium sp. SMC-4 TaxID=2857059 RepID=UPI0021B33557|nr:hypothetical protein [Mycobacterium sp. SMC-4]UXA18428.1 hypothetical protein KXD98_01480 [Mycobacterium sp. SMC-4]